MEQYEEQDDYGREGHGRDDKAIKGYRIIIILMSVVLGFLTFQYFRTTHRMKVDFGIERDTLNSQIAGLITEIDNINIQNDSVSTELRGNIAAERNKADSLMTRLKKERYISHEKVRQYEREVGTLRAVMRRYVNQIDSLNNLNKRLAAENVDFRKQVATESTRANVAEERAAELSNKIKLGAIVKARNIQLGAYNTGGTNVNRASKASRFKTDFTLTANELTIPGGRTIYVRIKGPDGTVLTNNSENLFSFEGDMITYSADRHVDYDNKDLDVSIFFNYADITAGVYTAEIYMDGYLIGSAELSLR